MYSTTLYAYREILLSWLTAALQQTFPGYRFPHWNKKKLSLIFTKFIQIDYCTKRTRNLVEFFDISKPSPKHTLKILHRWCEITDYSRSTASKLSNKCYCIPSLLLSPCFCSCTRINNYISYASLFLKLNFLCPVSAWPIFESALE